MNTQRAAAARVDADSTIGVGHLRRCVTLLKRLRVDGFDVRLVARRRLGADVAKAAADIPTVCLENTAPEAALDTEDADADATLAAIGPQSPGSWVLVDHYGLGERWERRIKSAGHLLLALDDYRHRRHCADILVSDSATPFDPSLIDDCGPRILSGYAYALIDEDFAPGPQTSTSGARNVLISYGGSDPTGETAKAIEAVRRVKARDGNRAGIGRVAVVIGPANEARQVLESQARDSIGATVHIAPPSLAPVMRESDLVLTAGGNSMVEALAMRKPCLVTIVADNQVTMVEELRAARAITVVGRHAAVTSAALEAGLEAALADYDCLAQRAIEGSFFDHHGASRISRAMQDFAA